MSRRKHIALIGNPNSGKTSIFNHLTGLHKKVANLPGVTVEFHVGDAHLDPFGEVEYIDLPGTHSLFPRARDEAVVFEVLLDERHPEHPDAVICVVDASQWERQGLLLSQVMDLGLPVVVALTMQDVAEEKGIIVDPACLEAALGVPVVVVHGRKGKGIGRLKEAVSKVLTEGPTKRRQFFQPSADVEAFLTAVRAETGLDFPPYYLLFFIHPLLQEHMLSPDQRAAVRRLVEAHRLDISRMQQEDLLARHFQLKKLGARCIRRVTPPRRWLTRRIDRYLLHPTWGVVFFFGVLFGVFQAIFALAEYPMEWLEQIFEAGRSLSARWLPEGPLAELWMEGVLPGLGGVVVFIPQIAILFFLISILEDSGYMARAAFLMDRLMGRFGLSGRSLLPLVGGAACAIPSIMAARTIPDRRQRLLTTLVVPLVSCSARIPVFVMLIALVVPDRTWGGVFHLQGLALMGLYIAGFAAALGSAWLLKHFVRGADRRFLIMELPDYRMPSVRNALYLTWEKVRSFIWEAGRIIFSISILIWLFGTYGPPKAMEAVHARYDSLLAEAPPDRCDALQREYEAALLEHSYIGQLGKALNPVFEPLGYHWKINIAIVTSFVAREVFVGTLATLYGAEADDGIVEAIRNDRRADGTLVFSKPTVFSLLVFYLFALQCISTIVVFQKENRSWRWTAAQFFYMFALAYGSAYAVYHVLA